MESIAWHQHCVLRDDVRQGTLTLAEFAADLYAVRTGDAPNVYRLPDLFFSRTYPTYNLKTLVRDVLHRLSGQGGKPVIRVQVAYGGGKTHALITLLHLAERSDELKTHSTVQEFLAFSGLDQLPKARVAMLPFDKFDVKAGLEVVSPDGVPRQVKTPWGALAYQLAGDDGLAKVAAHEADYITPAEPLLVELLKAPQAAGLSTLILIDEAVIYMRGAVNDDPRRLGTLQDFFQLLTQAVGKIDRAAMVASLISSDIVQNDPTGVQVLNAMEGVFHRMEETVEPVSREDVSELLRRRLFESVADAETRRAVVDRLAGAMQKLPLRDSHKDQRAYDRLLNSYPFHPDLLEVFYQKWTQLSDFQRTRGVLRTFAIALKASDGKDSSAFVGPGSLLGAADEPVRQTQGMLSEACRELIEACEEGNLWTPILSGELEKARDLQTRFPRLVNREIEQAVIATFLHSQPLGQKADGTDLYGLLAHPEIDRMSVEEGLSEWRKVSWFLKEDESIWCLGTTPNLTNMHVRAMERLSEDQIHDQLTKRMRDARLGQNADDVVVHTLPNSLADIPDNPDLRFVIVGPESAAVPGRQVEASLEAFFNRTYRNHVIVLAPEHSRLAGLRYRIRKILGWQGIESSDELNLLSETQKALLLQRKRDDENGILDSVKSTYSVLIAVDFDGEIKARLLPTGTAPPFERVKTFLVEEERLLTTSLDPELLTPDSFFELWGDEETAKPVQRLYGMFASLPRLPRVLGRKVFIETLRRGVMEGRIVLRTVRPDGSQQTFWRESPSDEDLSKKDLEIVPLEHATLHHLNPERLRPGQLPDLWSGENAPISVATIRAYFGGDDMPQLASDDVLSDTIRDAVQSGLLMARRGEVAYLKETIPDAEMCDALELLSPLPPIVGTQLGADAVSEAWKDGVSSVGQIRRALSTHWGTPIPWSLMVDAVNDGLSQNRFNITDGSPLWPSTADQADLVGLQVSHAPVTLEPAELIGEDVTAAWESGQTTLGVLKETLESQKGVTIGDALFLTAAQDAINRGLLISESPLNGDDLYPIVVKQPQWIRFAEAHLTEADIQDLPERIAELTEIAPELDFRFRITITAEGEAPSDAALEGIDDILGKIQQGLTFK